MSTDRYVWQNAAGGAWGTASNWRDVTSGANPATTPPGATNPVAISGSPVAVPLIITGGGSSASLETTNNVALTGMYATGAVSVGTYAPPASSGTMGTYAQAMLRLDGGAAVSARTVYVLAGTAMLSGSGATLSATSTVRLGAASQHGTTANPGSQGQISIYAGATLNAAANLAVTNGALTLLEPQATATIGGNLTVGAAGSTAGGVTSDSAVGSVAVSGKLTVGGGATLVDGAIRVGGPGATLKIAGTLTSGYILGTLSASSGGSMQLGGLAIRAPVAAPPLGDLAFEIDIDSTSSIEVGTAGGAANHAFTVDAGETVTSAGVAFINAPVVANGVIAETGPHLSVGNLSGSGRIQIGEHSTLTLNGLAAASTTIAFAGQEGVLEINHFYQSAEPFPISSAITGFATGDTIVLDGVPVTSATYASTGIATGTLTLRDGSTTLETLTLRGADYTGRTFAVSPSTAGEGLVTLVAASAGTVPHSPDADTYEWIGRNGELWESAANWADTTAGANPASLPPGDRTSVTIAGRSDFRPLVVAGGGRSASLGLTGAVALSGDYTTGALSLGTYIPPKPAGAAGSYAAASLALGAGSSVSAATVSLLGGTILLSGVGAKLSTIGTLRVGYAARTGTIDRPAAYSTITLGKGATLTSGSLVLAYGNVSVSDTQTTVTVNGNLTVGTAASVAGGVTTSAATGVFRVQNGAGVSVTNSVTLNTNSILVSNAGSALTIGRTVTANYGNNSLYATDGGSVRVGALVAAAQTTFTSQYHAPGLQLGADAKSSIEVGTVGSAAKGALTIDAGKSLTAKTATSMNGNLIDNGTIAVTSAPLTIFGNLSGSGTVRLGDDATLLMRGNAASETTIAFTGHQGALEFGPFNGFQYRVDSTVTGFTAGNAFVIDGAAISKVVYASTGANPGSLTFLNGSTAVSTLKTTGADLTGGTWYLSPLMYGGSVATLLLPSTGVTSPMSTNADAYTWVGPNASGWGTASNWVDTTLGAPAGSAPGTHTAVTILGRGGMAPLVIAGGGRSASLTLTETVALSGHYNTRTLSLGTYAPSASPGAPGTYTAATLGLGVSSSVAATTVNLLAGSVTLRGAGARLASTGTVTLGAGGSTGAVTVPASVGNLTLGAGATLTSGDLVVADGTLLVTDSKSTATIGGDMTFGTAGAARGSLDVENGGKITVAGAATIEEGQFRVAGATSSLTIAGTLTLATGSDALGSGNSVTLLNGSSVRVGGLIVGPSGSSSASASIDIEQDSFMEVGSAGGAAKGVFTVDAGETVLSSGRLEIFNDIVDNGTISQTGAKLSIGGLSGSGTIRIGDAAVVALFNAAAATATIDFAGHSAALEIGSEYISDDLNLPADVRSTITGFDDDDRLVFDDVNLVQATYASTGANVGNLTLYDDTNTAVETLRLAGADYTGRTFSISGSPGVVERRQLAAADPCGGAAADVLFAD